MAAKPKSLPEQLPLPLEPSKALREKKEKATRERPGGWPFTGTITSPKRPLADHEEALRKAAQEMRKRAKQKG